MTGFAVNLSNYFRACTLDLHFIRSGADGEASNGKILSTVRKKELIQKC